MRKKKEPEIDHQYIFSGRASLSGVQFYITAKNEEEARSKARSGKWDEYDAAPGEIVDCRINEGSCELNE